MGHDHIRYGVRYGWFSPLQASRIGYAVYLLENGTEVKITEVTQTNIASIFFKDVKPVGKVFKFKASYFKEEKEI